MLSCCWCGNRQIHQVVVLIEPHMHNRLQFHLARLGIVDQHFVTNVERADGLLAVGRRYHRASGEATGMTEHVLHSIEHIFCSPNHHLSSACHLPNACEHEHIHSRIEHQVSGCPSLTYSFIAKPLNSRAFLSASWASFGLFRYSSVFPMLYDVAALVGEKTIAC